MRHEEKRRERKMWEETVTVRQRRDAKGRDEGWEEMKQWKQIGEIRLEETNGRKKMNRQEKRI